MIFNLKFTAMPLPLSDTAISDFKKIIVEPAQKIIKLYEEIGEVILPTETKYSSPFLTLLPKENGKYLLGKSINESVDFIIEKIADMSSIKNEIGLLSEEEYLKQNSGYPKAQMLANDIYYSVGLVRDCSGEILSLDDFVNNKDLYCFVARYINDGNAYDLVPDDRSGFGAVVFGARNPFHYYLHSILERIKS